MAIPNYDTRTARKTIHAFVPISRFNKGEAGKIIDEVKADGIRVVVKNNVPECVIISVDEYDHIMAQVSTPVSFYRTKEEDEKRKAFIKRIREDVPPPIPATRDRKEVMDEIGPIFVDEEAVNELRRISMPRV